MLIVRLGAPTDIDELRPTLHALGGTSRRITIVTSVPYESCASPIDPTLRAAVDRLKAAAARLRPWSPRLVVVPGHPRTAPARFANAEQIELILYAESQPHP